MPREPFALLLLLATAVGAGAEVPTTANPAGAPATRTFTCEEIWRVGADPDEEFILGVVGDAVRGDDGNIYLLDTQTQTAHRFAPDGRYLGEAARAGEGPGELALVYFVRRWDDGMLAFGKVFPAEVIVAGEDGTPGGSLRLQAAASPGEQAFLGLTDFARRDGNLVAMLQQSFFDGAARRSVDVLASFAADGVERHRFGEKPSGYDFSRTIEVDEEKDFFALHRWALGPGGTVYVAPERNAYLIEARNVDGELLRRITRDVEPRRRSDEEKEAVKNGYTFSSSGGEVPEVRYAISDFDPPIAGLAWRDDALWVEVPHGKPLDGSHARRFDICDGAGDLREERRYVVPGDEDRDRLVFLGGDLLLRVANLRAAQDAQAAGLSVRRGETMVSGEDEGAPLEVVLYRTVELQ